MNLSFTTSKSQLEALPPPTHIILASQSIGRKQILEKLGIRFRTIVTRIDEDSIVAKDPFKTIEKRAAAKLEEVIKNPRVYMLDDKAHNLIIAADSMAILGKKTYGKSQTREEAKAILKDLMDKTHQFVTSVSVAFIEKDTGVKKRWDKTISTKVTFRKMTNPEIDIYITRFDFGRFAAAYALNECPWDLVTKIDGSYTNVIGLPLEVMIPIFRSLDIIKPPENI